MPETLAGSVCLVTGASQGIGWALAEALADRGAEVYVCDISQDKIDHVVGLIPNLPWPSRIRAAKCDVADRGAFEAWVNGIYRDTGRIDVLVNNAAYVRWQDVPEMSVEDAERTMDVAYRAMVYGVKAVLPLMHDSGHGHIVNIGSSTGRIFVRGPSAAYAAAKAAVDAYTQMLRLELRRTPVHVMLVRLATVAGTDFFRQHVRSSRMPRIADFVPYLTPPQAAEHILRGLLRQRTVVDVPSWLWAFYLWHDLAPESLRWLVDRGGSSRRDFGRVAWDYVPRDKGEPAK